jgi:hypothetical protein
MRTATRNLSEAQLKEKRQNTWASGKGSEKVS